MSVLSKEELKCLTFGCNWSCITRSEFSTTGWLSPSSNDEANHNSSSTPDLTEREREIAQYIVGGYTNRYIASKLFITEGTVKRTAHNIYCKLNVSSRVELVKLLNGLI